MRELWLFDDAHVLGGAELMGLRLARYLRDERPDLEPRLVCPPQSELAARAQAADVPLVPAKFPELNPRGLPSWPGAIAGFRSLLLKAGPEAIAVASTARAQAYITAALPFVRRASRPPVVHLVVEQQTLERASGRWAYRNVGSIVALGDNVATVCRQLFPGAPIFKANNFFLAADGLGDLRPKVPDGKPSLLALGRISPEKGLIELVDDLAAIPESWEQMVIAGGVHDHAYADQLEQRIESLGLADRITLPGFVENIAELLAAADAVVVPSTGTEGQPGVIIEALAAGVPAIVRSPVWSPDFDGLPVLRFDDAAGLQARLEQLPLGPAPRDEVRRRFGPEQLLDAIIAAAEAQK